MHAVDVGLQNAVEPAHRLLHLGSRHVLAFPAEGIADAVDEIEVAVLGLAHQIAGAKPHVAFFEHVVQDLSVGLHVVGVAVETLAGPRCVLHDLADDFPGLVDIALDAEAALVPHRLLGFRIEAHDLGREACGHPPGQPAHCAFLSVEIEQRDVALGRRIELDDLRNLEPPLELRPHVGAQAVAARQAQMMLPLFRSGRRVDEITAKLADILKARAVPAHDVVPELARGEFVPDHHRPAVDQKRAGRDHAAGGVIERQAIVHAVAGARVHDPGKRVARQHHAIMVDVGGLGQARRSRRVDVERAILDGERGKLSSGEVVAADVVERAVDTRQIGVGLAVNPDFTLARDMRPRAFQRVEQFGRDDDVLWAHHVDAIGERRPGEVRVDERDHGAGARDPDPGGQEFRPPRHHQTDGVALAQMLCQRPARIAVGARRELAIGEALVIREERRRVAVLIGKLEDHLRKDAGGVLGDGGCQLESAQRALEGDHLRGQPIEQSHNWSGAGRRFSPVVAAKHRTAGRGWQERPWSLHSRNEVRAVDRKVPARRF